MFRFKIGAFYYVILAMTSMTTSLSDHRPIKLSDTLLDEVGSREPIKIDKSLQKDPEATKVCWHEYVMMRETEDDPDHYTWKEFEVVFDTPDGITDTETAENRHQEVSQFNLTDLETGKAELIWFTTIFKNASLTIRRHQKTRCGTGKFLVKKFSQWDDGAKKRVSIKLTDEVNEEVDEFSGFLSNKQTRKKAHVKGRATRVSSQSKRPKFDTSMSQEEDQDTPRSLSVGKMNIHPKNIVSSQMNDPKFDEEEDYDTPRPLSVGHAKDRASSKNRRLNDPKLEEEEDYDTPSVGKMKNHARGRDYDRLGESAPLDPENPPSDDADEAQKNCSSVYKLFFGQNQLFRSICGVDFKENDKFHLKGGYVVSKKVVEVDHGRKVEKDKPLFVVEEDSDINIRSYNEEMNQTDSSQVF